MCNLQKLCSNLFCFKSSLILSFFKLDFQKRIAFSIFYIILIQKHFVLIFLRELFKHFQIENIYFNCFDLQRKKNIYISCLSYIFGYQNVDNSIVINICMTELLLRIITVVL